jgi:hypothetical protein
MSVMLGRGVWRSLLVACAVGGLLAVGGVSSQAQQSGKDLLEQFKQRQSIAAQKLESEVRTAILDAQKLLTTDPAEAVDRLERALRRVEDDADLPDSRRNALLKDLKDRLANARVAARRAGDRDADRNAKRAVETDQRTSQERAALDDQKQQQLLRNIRELQKQGRYSEASRLAADVVDQYRKSPAAQATSRIMTAADQLNELRSLRSERDFRTALAFLDVERSAMPAKGDIEFPSPAKWKEITKLRSKVSALSAKEKAILEALGKPIDIDLKDAKFEEVIAYLEEKTGLTFLVDKNALEQANVTYDTPVTVKARQVSLRTIFRKVLGELNLAYVVKDQMLQITSGERAKNLLTTRVYYLGDLVGLGGFNFGPLGNAMQMYNDVTQLIATIYQSVDPDSWEINGHGGFGTITFNPGTMTLIVKASAEVHYSLVGGNVR